MTAPFRSVVRVGLRWFGRRYDYDTAYLAAMLEASPAAFVAFALIGPVTSYRSAVPAGPWFAAKLMAAVGEDCGPCTQLVVNLAREAGVPADEVRAVLERDFDVLAAETRAAIRFAEALLGRTDDEDAARDEVRARWGDAGVVDLSLAIAISRVYPMTKAGLGYARECRLVQVGAAPVVVRHAVAG